MTTTDALFALKVQRKESNGVAGLAAAGSSLDRQKARQFVPSQRCRSTTNVHARTPAEILAPRPELRIPGTAAQTRIVSAGEFRPSQRELSRHLKYMARARIPEFESSHPRQAVRSLRCDFRVCENRRHSARLQRRRYRRDYLGSRVPTVAIGGLPCGSPLLPTKPSTLKCSMRAAQQ